MILKSMQFELNFDDPYNKLNNVFPVSRKSIGSVDVEG